MNTPEFKQSDVYRRLQRLASESLGQLMRNLPGLTAGVIATADGFEVAANVRQGMDAAKLAAMACSISALGAMVGKESSIGACRNVLIEAEGGYALIIEVTHPDYPMILNLVAAKEEVLGQVLYRAKRTAEALSALR